MTTNPAKILRKACQACGAGPETAAAWANWAVDELIEANFAIVDLSTHIIVPKDELQDQRGALREQR